MIKKLSALFLALILLSSFSVFSFSASADVSASTVSGNKGDKVTVVINLNTNPGFACLGLFVEYDTNALELLKAYDEGLMGVSTYEDLGGGKYSFKWGEKGERHLQYTQTGELVSITFRIKDKAKNAKYEIKLSYDRDFTDDIEANPISLTLTNGAIVVNGSATTTTKPNAVENTTTTASGGNQSGNQGNSQSGNQSGNQGGNQNSNQGGNQGGSTAKPESSSVPYSGQVKVTETPTKIDAEASSAPTLSVGGNTTGIDGTTVYSQELAIVTDENGSEIPEETALPEQDGADALSEDIATPEAQSDSKAAKTVIVIVVFILLCALAVFFILRSKKQKTDQ